MAKRRWACTGALALALMLEPALAAVSFDLAGYRQRAATDRAAGIAEGRAALDAQVFHGDPVGERTLLWYMGGAAIGQPDDVALGEVVLRLEALADAHDDAVAASYAGFLRGARLIDQGRHGEGLAEVLRSANPLADHEDVAQRIVAASELCRGYVNADRAAQALPHCQRHTRMVSATGDPVALARAEYMEAGVLSRDGQPALAIPLWERARDRFAAAGLDVLAGRTAGSLAGDLRDVGRYEDALTGLPNRRAIYERCQLLLAEPGAAGLGHALLMVDVDHFKDVNDRGGHPFGDEVLVRIGRSLQAHTPAEGMVARLGGEEFLVLCPAVGEARALECAEALRRDVASLPFRLGQERLSVTISLGVALFDGAASHDLSSWLSQADRAVYRAKQAGRDRVEL